ncbi:MAG: hypothetical protein FWG49_08170 [Leptospirales bacterium]|nr:hypothetical protein [Leptospirales bacterium]
MCSFCHWFHGCCHNYIKNKNNKSQEFILEFDESQHFTHLRKIALENYPKTLNLGFNREKWMDLCKSLDRHDIDPIYRDEQRAWYDTLRDFAPLILGIAPTVRLYASDFIWCQLNPNDKKDLETFKDFIESKSNIQKEEVTKQTTINSNENIVNSLDSAVAKSSENIVSKKETNIINKKYSKNYFLLVKKDKSGLYQTINNEHILVELDDNNNLISSKMINEKFKEANIIFSLDDINNKYLNLANNQNIFEYLVSWESELERIFNSIRYKYLSSVFKSGTENPSEFLQVGEHMKYNRSFQALAGKKIYQGGTLERKENSDFWKDVGFKNPKETGVNFDKEIEEFNFILHFLRRYYQNDLIKVYCELIAIKPGFHELVIHGDFFDLKPHVNIVNKNMINKNAEDGRVDYRGEVFALLRNVGNIENSPILDLKKFPADINTNSYFTYASCQVTEGPLVSRKNSELSYFEEIRKIKSKEEIKSLEDKFNILYYNKGIDSRDKLEKILKEAEKFRYFNN